MGKDRIKNDKKEKEICELCGCEKPWHFMDCYTVAGNFCGECGARFPRHYPNCSQDTINFSRWWIPMYDQKDLVAFYFTLLEVAKLDGTYREPPKPEPPIRYPGEHNVNPLIGRRIVAAITVMLDSSSHKQMLAAKAEILKEIIKIAKQQREEV